MQNKRGQLTIIIIIAIIIVAVVLLTVLLWPKINSIFLNKEQGARLLASNAEPLRRSISDCVKEASSVFFDKIGLQAGYYDTTGSTLIPFIGNDFVVVMYKNSAKQRINKLPSINQIENSYQAFLQDQGNAMIDQCLNNLASFKRTMDIEVGERKITPLIYYDAVVLQVDWPMKLSKQTSNGKVEQNINQGDSVFQIPLGYIWQTANKIIDCEVQVDCSYEGIKWDEDNWNNPFRLQYISKEAVTIEEGKIAFFLESIPYRPNEKPYKFNFAINRN